MKNLLLVILVLTVMFAPLASDSKDQINAIDRFFMQPYNSTLDKTADFLQYASLLTPAVLMAQDMDEWPTIVVMYAESLLLSYGLSTLGKTMIQRDRPYTYYDSAPENLKDEWKESFPSRHSVAAFTGATFASYVFCRYNPDSKWRIPVVATSYALAAATASLRVASGNHFLSDVLTGAAIGVATGLIIPILHETSEDKVKASISPFTLAFSISL